MGVKMVDETIRNGKIYYVCSQCGMTYKRFKEAKICEERCLPGKKCYMIKNSISF